MNVRISSSYVDRLIAEQDLLGLYQVVGIRSEEGELPPECWLSTRLLEWEGATRSGIWQYYEGLAADTFQRVSLALDQAGFTDIAEQYRYGQQTWDVPEQVASVDRWIDDHQPRIKAAVLSLLAGSRSFLCAQT